MKASELACLLILDNSEYKRYSIIKVSLFLFTMSVTVLQTSVDSVFFLWLSYAFGVSLPILTLKLECSLVYSGKFGHTNCFS